MSMGGVLIKITLHIGRGFPMATASGGFNVYIRLDKERGRWLQPTLRA